MVICRIIIAVAIACVFAAPVAAQSNQASLGDLARKVEAERAGGVNKAKKSYTNADLHAPTPAEADPPEPSDGYVSASTGKVVSAEEMIQRSQQKVDAASGAKMPEEHWRQRADFIRSEYQRAQNLIDQIKSQPIPRSLPAQALRENEFKKIRQMVDGLSKQWDRLAESARVAKVPEDWVGAKPTFTP